MRFIIIIVVIICLFVCFYVEYSSGEKDTVEKENFHTNFIENLNYNVICHIYYYFIIIITIIE